LHPSSSKSKGSRLTGFHCGFEWLICVMHHRDWNTTNTVVGIFKICFM
jgi:hypothetical protein